MANDQTTRPAAPVQAAEANAVEMADSTAQGTSELAPVVLTVCTTCRRPGDAPDAPRAGRQLARTLASADLPEHVELRGVECLSSCSRSCVIQLTGGENRWSYVYGDLDPATQLDEIVDGLRAYSETHDGIVPWRERPTAFRKQSITRMPPCNMPGVNLSED